MDFHFLLFLLLMSFYFVICFFSGDFILRISGAGIFTFSKSILMGFISNVSIYGILYVLISHLSPSFNIITSLYLAATLAIFVPGVITFTKATNKNAYLSDDFKSTVKHPLFIIVAIFVIAISIINSYLASPQVNDEYFVSIIRDFLDTKKIPPGVSYYGWEGWIATICRLIKIDPYILVRNGFPLFVTPLCFFTYYQLAIRLFSEKKKQLLFMIFIIFSFLFGGYGYQTPAMLLAFRSWRGASLMALIVFPIILALFIDVYRAVSTKRTWILFSIILVFGSYICATGKYLVPFYYCICLIPLLIILIGKKNYKRLATLLRDFFLAFLPCIIIMIDSQIMPALSGADKIYYQGLDIPDWGGVFLKSLFFSAYFGIFILAYAFFTFYEKDNDLRLLFCGIVPLIFVTILNPLLIPLTSKYITGTASYGQIYWMFPVYTMTAYIFSMYSFMFMRPRLTRFFAILMIAILILAGKLIYLV